MTRWQEKLPLPRTRNTNSDGGTRAGIRATMPVGIKLPLWHHMPGRLKQARETLDISSRALASSCGLSHVTVSRMERVEPGALDASIDTVEMVASGLGVSPCWLAYGNDGKAPYRARIPRKGKQIRVPRPAGPTPFEAHHAGCGERLRRRREAYGLSVRQLASQSGVSRLTIADIEKGKAAPRLDSVYRLAVTLDMAPCWLAYGLGEKPRRVQRPVEEGPARAGKET